MKILKTEVVYTAKYFKINKRTIERDGNTYTKDFIERNPVVMIIPYTADGHIYLESQYRDALQTTCIEVVAGNMEAPFDPLENAKRELLEETGLTAKTWKLIGTWELSPNMISPLYIFTATDLTEGEQVLDSDEEIEVIKLPLEKILKKIQNGEINISSQIAVLLYFIDMWKDKKI